MKKGILICFVGVDGSGKTTHAKNLENYLKSRGMSSKYLWCGWRKFESFLFKPIIKFVRINKNDKNNSSDEPKMNKFDYIHYFAMFDYILRVIPSIFTSLYRYDYIIADRYIFDVIVGFSVNNSDNIFKKIFWIFPKPNMIFYIDIPENIAYSRKNDIPSIEYLQKRKSIYKEFMKKYNVQCIDGTKSIEYISHTIQKMVIN